MEFSQRLSVVSCGHSMHLHLQFFSQESGNIGLAPAFSVQRPLQVTVPRISYFADMNYMMDSINPRSACPPFHAGIKFRP